MSKSKGGGSGNDSKFFQNSNRKGETHELKLELNAPEKNKKKDAVKKVRAHQDPTKARRTKRARGGRSWRRKGGGHSLCSVACRAPPRMPSVATRAQPCAENQGCRPPEPHPPPT